MISDLIRTTIENCACSCTPLATEKGNQLESQLHQLFLTHTLLGVCLRQILNETSKVK